MLPDWMIEDLKKKKQLEDAVDNRPRLETPIYDDYYSERSKDEDEEDEGQASSVIEIQL